MQPRLGALRSAAALSLLAIAAAGCGGPPATEVPVPQALDELDPLLGDHLRSLIAAARAEPGVEPLTELDLAYNANGLAAEAREAFLAVSALAPRNPLPRLYAARAAVSLGEPLAARRELAALVRRWPELAPAQEALGRLRLREGDLEGAAEAYRAVVRLAPGLPTGYLGLAEVELQSDRPAAALETLGRVPADFVELPVLRFARGRALQALDRLSEAEPLLRGEAESAWIPLPDPWRSRLPGHVRDLPRLIARAREMVETGRAGDARVLMEVAHRAHPDHLGVAINLALTLAAAGDPQAARELLGELARRHPNRFEIPLNLASIRLAQGELEGAIEAADRALSIAPTVAAGHTARARALLALGRDEEALAALERAARRSPSDPEILVELAELLHRLGRTEDAVAVLDRGRALAPGHSGMARLYRSLEPAGEPR